MIDEPELTAAQFLQITTWLHRHAGIRMRVGKEGLVRSRLAKRLRIRGCESYRDYLDVLNSDTDGSEFASMIDALSTNTTQFMRERAHFDYLQRVLMTRERPLTIWSAGCSSGEEAYTIAMCLRAYGTSVSDDQVSGAHASGPRILATDLSRRMIERAREGRFAANALDALPPTWREQYWEPHMRHGLPEYLPRASLKTLLRFSRLNLMDAWPMQGPFDVIFCRNVMIYFDKGTQQRLIDRFHALLAPGGTLFVGHSESLTGLTHRFHYQQPAVYTK